MDLNRVIHNQYTSPVHDTLQQGIIGNSDQDTESLLGSSTSSSSGGGGSTTIIYQGNTMTPEDAAKLASIEYGAQVNQDAFSHVKVYGGNSGEVIGIVDAQNQTDLINFWAKGAIVASLTPDNIITIELDPSQLDYNTLINKPFELDEINNRWDATKIVRFPQGSLWGNYVANTPGAGAALTIDSVTGHSYLEVDRLYVRLKAYFDTLVIKRKESIGGEFIVSPANMKCIKVDELTDVYRCYFLKTQDGQSITNDFTVGTQAICKLTNADTTISGNTLVQKYYWRLVTNVGDDYIDLSKTDCDTDSDIPSANDSIIALGHRTDIDRQSAIVISSIDNNAPHMVMYQGINSYSLNDKSTVEFGYNSATNQTETNIYGKTYIGSRNQSSYINFNPQTELLDIKGNLRVSTGKTVSSLIAGLTENMNDYVSALNLDIDNLQNQIDGQIISYFEEYNPTLSNFPANEWTTDTLKQQHANDTFTNTQTGGSWRWQQVGSIWQWGVIVDTATQQALLLAAHAQDTADSKRRTFTSTPVTPYDQGDIWVQGSTGDIKHCILSRQTGSYNASDWVISSKYTDDTKANEALTNYASIQYLKAALNEDTIISGGLIQSSILSLGYTSGSTFNVMAGTSGLYDSAKNGGGIAGWYGGSMKDKVWYTTETMPLDVAKTLFRFDGSGYIGNLNIFQDNTWTSDTTIKSYSPAFDQIVFLRSTTMPGTPSGGEYQNSIPTGWYSTIPSGTDDVYIAYRTFVYYDPVTIPTPWHLQGGGLISSSTYLKAYVTDLETPPPYTSLLSSETAPEGWTLWSNSVNTTNTKWIITRAQFTRVDPIISLYQYGYTGYHKPIHYYLRNSNGVTITPEGHIIGKDYFLSADSSVYTSFFGGGIFGVGLTGASSGGSGYNNLTITGSGNAITNVQQDGTRLLFSKDSTFSLVGHTHAWSDIVSGKPTTLSGYGIGDAVYGYNTVFNGSLIEDIPQSFKTYDGPGITDSPSVSANQSVINIGDIMARRKQLIFPYQNDDIWYRRNVDGTWSTAVKLLHSGNYSSIIDSRYVLKAGDTMTGNLITRTVYPSTDNSVTSGTTSNRWTNVYSFNGNFSNVVTTTWLTGITNTSVVSNFNADLLDGLQSTDFTRSLFLWSGSINDFDRGINNSFAARVEADVTGVPESTVYNWNLWQQGNKERGSQFLIHAYGSGTGAWLRSSSQTGNTWGNWRKLAFEDSNVYSATKLLNGRYIYGQYFDGQQDIIDTFRSLLSNSANGSVVHSILKYNPAPYGLLTRIYNNGGVSLQSQRETTSSEYFDLYLNDFGGNVGIGTASPSHKLHVNGTGRFNGILFSDSRIYAGWDSGALNSISCLGWFRSANSTGWLNQTFGGGIYMEDTTWVRIFGGRGFYVENTIQTTGEVDANTFKITSADGEGAGISLYGGTGAFNPTYGLMFATTANYGTHGYVTADWATYFTMDDTANRGWIFKNTTAGNVFSISNGGSVWANRELYAAVGLYTDGYLSSKGQNTSDGRLKTNISKFSGTDIIKSLSPVSFRWNDTARSMTSVFDTDEVQYGLIAQETKKVAPWLVVDNMFHDGYMGVRYEKLIPVMLACQIEHLSRTEMLEKKVSKLEEENKELKRRLGYA